MKHGTDRLSLSLGYIIRILLIGCSWLEEEEINRFILIKCKSGDYEIFKVDLLKEHRLKIIVQKYENLGLDDFLISLLKNMIGRWNKIFFLIGEFTIFIF